MPQNYHSNLILLTIVHPDGDRTILSRVLLWPKSASSKAAGAYNKLNFQPKSRGLVRVKTLLTGTSLKTDILNCNTQTFGIININVRFAAKFYALALYPVYTKGGFHQERVNQVLNPPEFTRNPVLASNLVDLGLDLGFRETHFQDLEPRP